MINDTSDNNIPRKISNVLECLIRGDLGGCRQILTQLDADTPSDEYCSIVIEQLRKLIQQFEEGYNFITSVSEGNLDYSAPPHFYLFSHYKQLQSNLRHLTWQTQQIARGDYNQKVSYMGEFSVAFNQMIEALREKKKMEDQLRDLYATRDKFMSIISHDLKSPFNGILGFSQLLAQDYPELSDQERLSFIENIRISAQNAFKLLENLLEWSPMQTGKITFTPDETNLSRLVLENFLLLKPVAEKKNIHLYTEVPEDAVAYIDENSILTVIRNLISNAIKFSFNGSRITVRSTNDESFITISITDNGIGIPAKNLDKLFTLDEKYKTAGTDNEKGTGLGLLLCKEFVEKNGGKIWAGSEYGKGSTFSFSLPIHEEQKP